MRRNEHLGQLNRILEIRRIQLGLREAETFRAQIAKRRADEEQQTSTDLLETLETEWSISMAQGGISSGLGPLWANALVDQQHVVTKAMHAALGAKHELEMTTLTQSRASYCRDIAAEAVQTGRKALARHREERALAEATDQHPFRRRPA